MKTSTVLKKAKKFLWDGKGACPINKTPFICHACTDAVGEHSWRIRGMVMSRLDDFHSVTGWLRESCQEYRDWERTIADGNAEFYLQVQAYRHRWLDAMIEEFRAKGD